MKGEEGGRGGGFSGVAQATAVGRRRWPDVDGRRRRWRPDDGAGPELGRLGFIRRRRTQANWAACLAGRLGRLCLADAG
jgi:hypothetical protein